MSKLEELINKYCPDGVEYRTLGKVCVKNAFKQLGADELKKLKSDSINTKIKLLPSSNNNDWYGDFEKCKNHICNGEVITLGRARYANLKYHKGDFVSSNNIIIQAKNKILNTKFLYFFIAINANNFYISTSTYPKFDSQTFETTQIPLPPIEIQDEIVRILDKFTELNKELNKELGLRKKQYEYYRNKLLSFGDRVEYVPLWSITIWDKKFNSVDKIKQKASIKYKYFTADELKQLAVNNGDIKILTTNNTNLFTSEELVKDSFIADDEIVCIPEGGNAIVQYYKGRFITGFNRIAVSSDINKLHTKFLYYVLVNKLNLISSFYRGSGIKHPDMSKILDIIIPLPPLEKQKRIVNILDKFDALCNSLTEGLPKEIELRKKQYEYYRGKLFTFKERKA